VKLLIDENVSRHITERLILDGHDVLRGQDVSPGQPDTEMLVRALALNAVIVTEVSVFGDLVMREGRKSAGIVLLRLSGMARDKQPDYVAEILRTETSAIPGSFTVITPTSARHRNLP
jgi:predicted nuclease of predicted toxin-antitoxin system